MKKHDYIILGLAALAAISVFFPWIEVSSSYNTNAISYGGYTIGAQSASYTSNGISGISVGGGVLGLLLSIVGGYLFYKNNKLAFIAAAINVLNGLGYIIGWFGYNSSFSASTSFGSSKASFDPQIGLYIFVISSAAFAVLTFKNFKKSIS